MSRRIRLEPAIRVHRLTRELVHITQHPHQLVTRTVHLLRNVRPRLREPRHLAGITGEVIQSRLQRIEMIHQPAQARTDQRPERIDHRRSRVDSD